MNGKIKTFLMKILPPRAESIYRRMDMVQAELYKEKSRYETIIVELREEKSRSEAIIAEQREQNKQVEFLKKEFHEEKKQNELVLNTLNEEKATFEALVKQITEVIIKGKEYNDLILTVLNEQQKQNEAIFKELIEEKKLSESIVNELKEVKRRNDIITNNLQNMEKTNASIRNSQISLEAGMIRTMPQPRLSYFVLNILDHCNLRCKGCDHFAAIADRRFVAIEDIKRDLKRMSELTGQAVTRIGIMGGEPLLHPDLKEILAQTRFYFPSTVVHLVTNGLILLNQDDDFWRVCRENKITIVNTRYPIPLNHEGMQTKAKTENVEFKFYGNTGENDKTQYKLPLDLSGLQNPQKNFWKCFHANTLPLLMEGKFYACTVAPNVRHFNKKFGTNMQLEEGDWLDIYTQIDSKDILEFLSRPKPFCRFCNVDKRTFGIPWERSKQEMSEWTVVD